MLRLILTLFVGAALLVGIGAWFDPEGAREAIKKDLAGIAGHTVDELEGAVREAAEQAVEVARKRAAEVIEPDTAAGPRRRKPPVVAQASKELDVEDVLVEERSDFVESELEAQAPPDVEIAASAKASASGEEPPDPGAQGDLIRRMLALYARVSEGR